MVAYNIVFAGETGVGKSSLINMLFDLEVSPTSNDVLGVTGRRKRFIAVQDSDVYRQAIKELESLFKELESADGVHLLIFCFRFTEYFTNGLQRVYESVIASIHGIQVPIVAAVTHAEKMKQIPEDWWSATEPQRKQKGLIFADCACVSTLEDEDYPPTPGRRKKARSDMWRLIGRHAKALLSNESLPKVGRYRAQLAITNIANLGGQCNSLWTSGSREEFGRELDRWSGHCRS